MFNNQWFARYQTRLLWWLNSPLTLRWFRWVLCIRPCDVGYRMPIVALYPHAYVVLNAQGPMLTADIRTYDKFARRLYFAFRPLWWTLHVWDWCIADRWYPAWSFGFDSLTSYGLGGNHHAFVGRSGSNQTWSTAHDSAGNYLDIPAKTVEEGSLLITSGASSGFALIKRFLFSFDTSLLGADATVSAAAMSIRGTAVYDVMGIDPTMNLFRSTPSAATNLVALDFQECGDEAQATSGYDENSWGTDGYNSFTLTSNGLAHLDPISLTSWCLRESTYDAPDVAPTAPFVVGSSGFGFYTSNRTGTTQDPRLVITYTPFVLSVATQVDFYDNAGISTWNKPAGVRWVEIDLKAGGGGGGSGRKGAAGTVRCGGGGGGAGTHCTMRIPASVLGATETVTVGGGGAGGNQQTADSTDGVSGSAGEPTTFGTWGRAQGGAGGDGGNSVFTNGGDGYRSFPSFVFQDEGDGGISLNGEAGSTPADSVMRAGGGGGGGVDVLDVAHAGGVGGTVGGAGVQSGYGGSILGGAGGAVNGPGVVGTDAPVHSIFGGGGGGGGGARTSPVPAVAGLGGDGGVPGGGGGGGGASVGHSSGAGGDGGSGLAIVVSYF